MQVIDQVEVNLTNYHLPESIMVYNNGYKYLEDAQIVGAWTNGKPIHRQIVAQEDPTIENLDKMILKQAVVDEEKWIVEYTLTTDEENSFDLDMLSVGALDTEATDQDVADVLGE